MTVSIIGTGSVGRTTGVCLAFLGHKVTCLDTDQSKIEVLQAGRTPIYEPWLEDLMALAAPNLRFTTRYEEAIPQAEVVFIVVGTPPLANGSPDLSCLSEAAGSVGRQLAGDFTVVVNKSTVPIGSGNWVEALIREAGPQAEFAVASNPEFLREGSALHDSLYPDRVVIGAVPLVSTDLASAQLIKYAANAFLALKISYILTKSAGWLRRWAPTSRRSPRGIGLDSRIGTRFLQVGIGWGGSCFGKDTAALMSTAAEYSLTMPIVEAAREIDDRQRAREIEKLLAELKILKGRTIGLLGLAFKPHTDDLREAPSLDIARKLIECGARVKAHDPVALARARREFAVPEMTYCDEPEQTARDADALVLVTEWPQYHDLAWEQLARSMRTPLLLDGRHFLDRVRLTRAGFRCLGIIG